MKRFVLLALLASSARADVWQHSIETGAPDAAQDRYDFEMKNGDEQTLQANARGIQYREVKHHVTVAAESYRAAAAAKPKDAEPYYRLGKLLYSFYFECDAAIPASNASVLCSPDSNAVDRKRAEEVIAAWDAFEARAPLDPRLTVDAEGNCEVLFERAILHTKLATKEHLVAATKDYEKILARTDDNTFDTVWSNLAETYMMIGRIDDAIDTYREALKRGANEATLYGLAVALDRDERGAQAKDLILSQSEESKKLFHQKVMTHHVFFVPAGEEYYYFALIDEAFGSIDTSVDYWQRYIHSPAGQRPEFLPRAKEHLTALLAQRKKHPSMTLPPPFPDEMFR